MASNPQALTGDTFAALMERCAPFEPRPVFAVAVSGGSDSMALVLLADEWAKEHDGRAVALTVDHGLRSESKEEAIQVAKWCAKSGIEHHTLTWDAPSLRSGMPEAAREARYKLLTDFCKSRHVHHLMTAHQREDQTETFFFRLARGSGLTGLACMQPVSQMHGVQLLRPLLSVPKAQLQATLRERAQPWIEDPSNHNSAYTRNRIRQYLANSRDPDTIHERTGALVESFKKFRNLMENKLASSMTDCVLLQPEGYAILQGDAFLSLPEELAIRLLSSLVMTVSGSASIPRGDKLARLYRDLKAPTPSPRRSFGGLLFTCRPGKEKSWLVHRETKATQGLISIPPRTDTLWDQRFTMRWEGPRLPMSARAPGVDGIRMLHRQAPGFLPGSKWDKLKMVLASVPSFWHLEEMVAIPHISWVHDDYRHFTFSGRFTPAKPLASHAA